MKARLMADAATLLSAAIAGTLDRKANRELSNTIARMRQVGEPVAEEPETQGDDPEAS